MMKTPKYYGSINFNLGLFLPIWFAICVSVTFRLGWHKTNMSIVGLLIFSVPLLIYLLIFIIVLARGKRIGHNNIRYFNNDYEIHIGKDSTIIYNFLCGDKKVKAIGKEDLKDIEKFEKNKQSIYIKLLARRIGNALKDNCKAYVVAHTWIEIYLYEYILLLKKNVDYKNASRFNAFGHALSQPESDSYKKRGYFSKYKKIYKSKKFDVKHYCIKPTDERIYILKLLENNVIIKHYLTYSQKAKDESVKNNGVIKKYDDFFGWLKVNHPTLLDHIDAK